MPRGTSRSYVANILRSGRHLLALIDGILELASVHAGRLNIAPAPVDPAALVNEVVDSQRSASEAKDLQLEVVVSAELGTLVIEERMLAAGCDGYIPKPIDTRTFARLLRDTLTSKGLR